MVVEKSRTISEVAKSYGLVPQTVGNWVNKWRKTHSGIEGEEMTAAQLAEYKKIKAELREARTGDRVLEKKRRPSSAAGVPAKNTIRIHPSAKKGRFQVVCAMLNSCSIFSAGVAQSSTRRGRVLRRSSACWTWVSVMWVKSVPLGKKSRIRPLLFSLVGRCQGEWGSQKYSSL